MEDFVSCFTSSMYLWMKMQQILNHIFKQCVIGEYGVDLFNFVNNEFLRISLMP